MMKTRRRGAAALALAAFVLLSLAAATHGSSSLDVKHSSRRAGKKHHHHAQFFASSELGEAAEPEPEAEGEGTTDVVAETSGEAQAPTSAPQADAEEAKEAVPDEPSLGRGRWTSAFDANPSRAAPRLGGVSHTATLKEETEKQTKDETEEVSTAGDDAAAKREEETRDEVMGEQGDGSGKIQQRRPKEAGLGRGAWVSSFDLPYIKRAGNSVGMWGSAYLEKNLLV